MTPKELYDLLDNWLHIGIADDLIKSPDQTKEFQPYVTFCKKHKIKDENIPQSVLGMILYQMEHPSLSSKIRNIFKWKK